MKRAVSPAFMRAWEQRAFARGVSAIDLMENAACALRDALKEKFGSLDQRRILFVCGGGNNGGDGLACARLCKERGADTAVWLLKDPQTEEAKANADRLGNIPVLRGALPDLTGYDAVVDALFGTGLSRPLEGAALKAVRAINAQDVFVLSVDIPSGMDGFQGTGECVRADRTLCLACLKTGVLLADQEKTGAVRVCDIGLTDQDLPEEKEGSFLWAEEGDLPALLPHRKQNAHKGDCGHVLLYAGSRGMAGAAAMAAKACLRGGAGRVTIACDEDIEPILQTLVPNAMCSRIDRAGEIAYGVLAAGCGLGRSLEKWEHLCCLLDRGFPAVLDADALTMLAEHPLRLSPHTVLTPHVGEAARLLHVSNQEVMNDQVAAARRIHQKYGGAVLLKSAVSVLYDGRDTALNIVGTPALAKGGSGDALTGILAAVLSQQKQTDMMAAMQASALWLGLAGRAAEQEQGVYSVLTGDVIDAMGPAYLRACGPSHLPARQL